MYVVRVLTALHICVVHYDSFAVSVWLMRFAAALAVVTGSTQALVIGWLPELPAEAHRLHVVDYSSRARALHTQRVDSQVVSSVAPPAGSVIALLYDAPLMHLLALPVFRHPGHQSKPKTYNSISTKTCQNKRSPIMVAA